MKHYFLAIKNIFNYKGEATINEFWSFFLINYFVLFPIFLSIRWYFGMEWRIVSYFNYISIVVLIPLGIRRLRNAGQPIWLFLFPFINLIMAGMPGKDEVFEED